MLHPPCIHNTIVQVKANARTRSHSAIREATSVRRPGSRIRLDKGDGGPHAYAELRRRIVSLDLQPGADIDEARLVRELGVSRTPVRAALVRLAGEGLVILLPNRGARVAAMDLPQLQEHLEAFELMQRAATRMAAVRRTTAEADTIERLAEAFETAADSADAERMIDANWRFHYAIALASHNRYIERMYTGQLTENLRIARLAMAYVCYGSKREYHSHLESILREHRGMVAAIRGGEADVADDLAASHANLARIRVTSYLGSGLGGTIPLRDARASARAG
jgi:DNA-binding GntR family transcriptional regulator